MTGDAITLRPIRAEDEEFLFEVYASTRQAEMNATAWNAAQRAAFLRSQFALQHHHYTKYFADAQFSVVERGGAPIGRLYVHRCANEIRIVDIALLPEHRTGIGRRLIKELLAEGARRGLPVRGHVEWNNPAIRLFQRIGFAIVGNDGPFFQVEWKPA
jgi:ribosomal protein S18 acetylase RimI-like enzyme